MKILKNVSIIFLTLGIVITTSLYLLAYYNEKNCVEYCTMTGVVEGMGIIFLGLPLTIIGFILYIIYYFRNKKINGNIENKVFNFGRVLPIIIIAFLVALLIIAPDAYFGLYNYTRDFIEVILGL